MAVLQRNRLQWCSHVLRWDISVRKCARIVLVRVSVLQVELTTRTWKQVVEADMKL